MKRLLWIFLLLAGGLPLFAQTPDCVIGFTFNATGQRSSITGCGHNTQGVFEWRVVYANTGFTGPFSLRIESSLAGVTWAAFNGTVNNGINPNTSTTSASTDVSGFNEYVSVALNAAAGAGTVTGVLYGCRQPGCSTSGATVTIPTPVPVDGPTPAGSAPTTPPVLVAGQDGTPGLIRTLKTDSLGELIPSNVTATAADGVSNDQLTPTGAAGGTLYLRVFEHVFNGATWDRAYGNTLGRFVQGPTVDGSPQIASAVPIGGRDMGGDVRTGLFDGNGGFAPAAASSANADGISNTQFQPTDGLANFLYSRNMSYLFNGTTYDRWRGNTNGGFMQGSVASGAANAGNPLKIGGPFNTTQPTVTNGQVVDGQYSPRGAAIVVPGVEGFPVSITPNTLTPSGAATAQGDGATNTPTVPTVGSGPTAETIPNYPFKFNGSTWDRDFKCTGSAAITFSAASGTLEFVALTGGQTIRICHVSLSSTVATNITFVYGTGTNCGSGTTSISGAYQQVLSMAIDLHPESAIVVPVSNAFCITSSVSATVGGLIQYAKF